MKAVRMYAPGDLRVEDIPIPEINDDEVLIKVMAVGVCGSDIPRANVYGAYISPITLGHEFAGQIDKVGKNVKGFSVGDRVTVPPLIPCYICEWCELGEYGLCVDYKYYGSRCEGAMAEYIAVDKNNLLLVHDGISYETAATTDPCANGLHGMKRADFKAGDSVDLKNKLIELLLNKNPTSPALSNYLLSKYTFEKTASIILKELL